MPRINIKELGITPQQANDMFSNLKPEEVAKKVEELQAVKAQNASTAETFTEKVNQIKGIQEDPYESMAVGPNAFSREGSGFKGMIYNMMHPIQSTKDFFTGGKQNFISDIQNLTSKETLDNLIKIKAAGGTFGSLTEKELDMLINSATKIGKWEVKDKDGNVTGYNIGEKSFNAELDRLKKLAEKAVVKAGGSVNSGTTSNGIKFSVE